MAYKQRSSKLGKKKSMILNYWTGDTIFLRNLRTNGKIYTTCNGKLLKKDPFSKLKTSKMGVPNEYYDMTTIENYFEKTKT